MKLGTSGDLYRECKDHSLEFKKKKKRESFSNLIIPLIIMMALLSPRDSSVLLEPSLRKSPHLLFERELVHLRMS